VNPNSETLGLVSAFSCREVSWVNTVTNGRLIQSGVGLLLVLKTSLHMPAVVQAQASTAQAHRLKPPGPILAAKAVSAAKGSTPDSVDAG